MIAQIKNIELNAVKEGQGGKTYKGTAVTYQGQPYKGQVKDPTTRFLFSNSDIEKQFFGSDAKVEDWVDISFDDTKWKNPLSFTVCNAPLTAQGNIAPAKNVTGNIPVDQSVRDDKDKRIARAVAIKEATQVIGLMISNEGYTKANLKKREFLVEEILTTARAFEPYLTLNDTVDDVMKDLYPEGVQGIVQEDFND